MKTVKTPPNSTEFIRFTEAMRSIMGVSKTEIRKRIEAEKKRKPVKVSSSRVSGAASKVPS